MFENRNGVTYWNTDMLDRYHCDLDRAKVRSQKNSTLSNVIDLPFKAILSTVGAVGNLFRMF